MHLHASLRDVYPFALGFIIGHFLGHISRYYRR